MYRIPFPHRQKKTEPSKTLSWLSSGTSLVLLYVPLMWVKLCQKSYHSALGYPSRALRNSFYSLLAVYFVYWISFFPFETNAILKFGVQIKENKNMHEKFTLQWPTQKISITDKSAAFNLFISFFVCIFYSQFISFRDLNFCPKFFLYKMAKAQFIRKENTCEQQFSHY